MQRLFTIQCIYTFKCSDVLTSFQAAVLKTQVEALLHMVKRSHYVTEEDNSWIEFLLKAVAHNNNKLPLLIS